MLDFAEGFDLYTTATAFQSITGGLWPASSGGGNIVVSTAQARTGTRSLQLLGNGNFYAQRVINNPTTDTIVGGAYFASSYAGGVSPTSSTKGLGVFSATADLRIVRVDNSGTMALYRGSTQIALFPTLAAVSTWNYFFIYYNAVTGSIRVYMNRGLQYSGSVTPIGALTFLRLGALGNVSNGSQTEFVDDVAVFTDPTADGETTALEAAADLSVGYSLAAADGVPQDWTFTGGASAFQSIDNVPPNSSEYIEGSNPADVSAFDMADGSIGVFQVFGVFTQYYSEKTTAGNGSIQASLISNTVSSAGLDRPQATTYQYFQDKYAVNPDGGGAWLPADLASLSISFERTA